ncbi:MBL fold metallo-hydrolase [Curtobacterium sp. S6]|uniref:MBL fold metallo-hydrolase n=1 Tax=Curtobacterium sp. S6 TaxID=1479623 RepID=UPI0004AAEE35|nr:MBL fold metallo-hydrolase [Curtobacterium sp. S6]
MRLTKYTHSCIRLDKDGSVLVLDPGNFSSADEIREALDDASFLLITHEHPDHYERETVHAVLNERRDLQVYATQTAADELREAVSNPERIHAVHGEEEFDAGPYHVRTFGGQHALIHPLIPTIQNVGFLIDDNLYHPGDSLIVPHQIRVQNLLIPIHAPWNKLHEVVDFLASVRPKRAFPIHDAMLAENGQGMLTKHATNFGAKYGSQYERLLPGETVTLEETS